MTSGMGDAGSESETGGARNVYTRALTAWVAAIARRPIRTLVAALLLTGAAGAYGFTHLRINSDDSALISQDEPFRRDYKEYIDAFPQFDETTVIVVTSDSFALADDAVDRLSAALSERDDLISTLFAPGADAFTEDHAFLYMDVEDLEDVVLRLAEAQPALAALSVDPSLRGLFREFEDSLDALEEDGELPAGFARMADRVSEVTEALLDGRPRALAWADEIMAVDDTVYRVVIVQGREFKEDTIASARLIDGIREIVEELHLTPDHGVEVRLTGMVPLGHDEMETLQSGLAAAGAISLALLTVILGFGVRSLRIVVSTFVTLGVSLVVSTAFAMATVGEFNIISASFAVLLIGLGVDFALHIGLRYEEETARGKTVPDALARATAGVGGAVSLCAVTSAIGFLSFVPTRYHGLGALGIIAGGGMLISLVVSFTVFPALLATMRAPTPKRATPGGGFAGLYPVLARHSGSVVAISAVVGAVAVWTSFQTTFDFSTLSMRNPASESMTTLRELQREDIVTDYAAIVIEPSPAAAEQIAGRLETLPRVSEVQPPSYYVPGDQDLKLELLEDAEFFLLPFLHPDPPVPPPTPGDRVIALESLRARIAALPPAPEGTSGPEWKSLARLSGNLDGLASSPSPERAVETLDGLVVSDLVERMAWLRRAVRVGEIEFDDLPVEIRERVIAPDGRTQVTALPGDDLQEVRNLIRFVDEVAEIAPHATGRPAVEAGIGDVVVSSFRSAIGLALVAIGVILLFVLRSPIDAVMVLTPITLAAVLTVAFGVWIDMPFNMTNVCVVPLILGLGVDNGIHVFLRVRDGHSLENAMHSSTPRAVLLSALTTLAAFSSLAVSDHPGIHSVGVLLAFSVVALILCALVVLPAMIHVRTRLTQTPR